jgi:peptidoglycan/xylan/chitin deacetylase (PgdA/CDA1 family)
MIAAGMGDLLVLCYHAVSERWPASLSVTPEALDAQLATLVKRGYRSAPFTDAVVERPRGKVVVLSFDDAYQSVIDLALPILERHGLKGSLYVPTDFPARPDEPMSWPGVDGWLDGPHRDELRPMGWDGVRELAERGWEIGSHTCTHPHLTELDDARLEDELVRSKRVCEAELGRPCRSLAYPYGDHDDRVVAAAGRAGYTVAGTLPSRFDSRDALAWPRAGIYHGDDARRFALKISRPLRLARTLPLWPGESSG